MGEAHRRNGEKQMSENYIVINGKKMDLTEEQLKQLRIEVRKNPFGRVSNTEDYYYINSNDCVTRTFDTYSRLDTALHDHGNYFNGEAFAEQVALRQLLNRKLLKFSYDTDTHMTFAEMKSTNCGHINPAYVIKYNPKEKDFTVLVVHRPGICDVTFSTLEAAEEAIEKVVKPFCQAAP